MVKRVARFTELNSCAYRISFSWVWLVGWVGMGCMCIMVQGREYGNLGRKGLEV